MSESAPDGSRIDETRRTEGMAARRRVLGDAHVDRAVANTTDFTSGFQDFITRYAWGELWAGDGMAADERSCVTLAILAALGCEEELRLHVHAALRNGVPTSRIQEVLHHVAVYAGAPRANRAFAIADEIITDHNAG